MKIDILAKPYSKLKTLPNGSKVLVSKTARHQDYDVFSPLELDEMENGHLIQLFKSFAVSDKKYYDGYRINYRFELECLPGRLFCFQTYQAKYLRPIKHMLLFALHQIDDVLAMLSIFYAMVEDNATAEEACKTRYIAPFIYRLQALNNALDNPFKAKLIQPNPMLKKYIDDVLVHPLARIRSFNKTLDRLGVKLEKRKFNFGLIREYQQPVYNDKAIIELTKGIVKVHWRFQNISSTKTITDLAYETGYLKPLKEKTNDAV